MSPKQKQSNQNNMKALGIVYPIFAYFAVCQIVSILLGLLPFADQIDAVKRQGLGSLVAFIVLYLCFVYRKAAVQDRSGRNHADRGNPDGIERSRVFAAPISLRFFAGIAAAVLLLQTMVANTWPSSTRRRAGLSTAARPVPPSSVTPQV